MLLVKANNAQSAPYVEDGLQFKMKLEQMRTHHHDRRQAEI